MWREGRDSNRCLAVPGPDRLNGIRYMFTDPFGLVTMVIA
jgi:hypothetical protein